MENDINQLSNYLALRQKSEIIRYVRSKKLYQILDNIVTTIYWMIKKKVDIIFKPWQISTIINIVYKKKDAVISAGTRCNKSLSYQLIHLIREKAIIFVVLPNIALVINQVCLFIITFYCKLQILIIIVSMITKTRNQHYNFKSKSNIRRLKYIKIYK